MSTNEKLPENKKKKKIRVIQKESALTAIYASGNLTAAQKKAFNAFLFIGRDYIRSGNERIEEGISVPVSYFKSILGDKTNNYSYLKKTVESLQDFTVESNVLGKDKTRWDRFSLVAGATIKDGILTFSFPHQIIEALKNPKMYVTLDLDEVNRIERKHAISLYEILEDYKKITPLPKWTIHEFRMALDIPDNTYKSFRDLHRRVIAPAVKEINEKFGLGVEYTLFSNLMAIPSSELEPDAEKRSLAGRKRIPKITHIQFAIKKEKFEERLSYKNFIEQIRKEYMPKPEEGHFPTICELDGKSLKVNAAGRLYFTIVREDGSVDVEELTPQESEKIWKRLWKEELEKELAK